MKRNSIKTIQAVIFDFDDTLVNSDRGRLLAHKEVGKKLRPLLQRVNVDLPLPRLIHYISDLDHEMDEAGMLNRDRWWPELFTSLTGEKMHRGEATMLTKAYWRAWIKESKPYADTTLTLAWLKKNRYKLALVSDTDGVLGLKRRRIRLSGLRKYFHVIVVAGEDSKRQKPDRGPFLLASRRLDVPPHECIMVGDSMAKDVQGAIKAGMRAVLIQRKRRLTIAKPDTIGRLSDLAALLKPGQRETL